jgi:hypothetical protein
MTWADWDKAVLALTLWREARGEGQVGMQAVGCVIRNRVTGALTYNQVIEKAWQFSSLTAPGDPMLVQWPVQGDVQFEQAMLLAEGIYLKTVPDITNGATHYFNPSVVLPKWAASMTKVASIGHHDFYK